MASDSHAHAGASPEHHLAHHFDTPVQQFDAAKLGMWLFLAQELLFFSGLFVAYLVFRLWYPDAWSVGSHELDWKLGTVNTLVLLFSSLTAWSLLVCMMGLRLVMMSGPVTTASGRACS